MKLISEQLIQDNTLNVDVIASRIEGNESINELPTTIDYRLILKLFNLVNI